MKLTIAPTVATPIGPGLGRAASSASGGADLDGLDQGEAARVEGGGDDGGVAEGGRLGGAVALPEDPLEVGRRQGGQVGRAEHPREPAVDEGEVADEPGGAVRAGGGAVQHLLRRQVGDEAVDRQAAGLDRADDHVGGGHGHRRSVAERPAGVEWGRGGTAGVHHGGRGERRSQRGRAGVGDPAARARRGDRGLRRAGDEGGGGDAARRDGRSRADGAGGRSCGRARSCPCWGGRGRCTPPTRPTWPCASTVGR